MLRFGSTSGLIHFISMSQNKSKKPILIRDEGGIQIFRNPDTGEEFSTTVSRPIEGMEQDSRLVALKCIILEDREIAKRLAEIRSAVGSDHALDNRQMLSEARAKGSVTVPGLRRWRAEQIRSELKSLGLSVDIIVE